MGYAVCLLAQVVGAKKNLRAKSFDFYVLSMSYQPEFCHMKRKFSYAGCEKPQDFWRSSLTIHGMTVLLYLIFSYILI